MEKGEICLIKLLRNQQTLQLSGTPANFIWEKGCDQLSVCLDLGLCVYVCVWQQKKKEFVLCYLILIRFSVIGHIPLDVHQTQFPIDTV